MTLTQAGHDNPERANPPEPRKKRDTSAKRQTILDGAVRVFTEKGFDASSMDRIAEVAGVSKRTVYNHFPSKEALFQAIVAEFLTGQDSIKPVEYLPSAPLDTQLKQFARAELYLIDDTRRRSLSRLLTSVFLMDTDFATRTHGQHQPHAALIAWLTAARHDRRLDLASPELAARLFYGMVEGCLTWPALMSDGASLAAAEALLDELVAAFLSRYAPAA